MRATILLSIAALFSAASTWNILKDARPLTVDHNAQHTLQDLNPPTDNDQLLENSVTGTTLYEAVDTNGDISIFEKLPSPLEPEFYHQTSADTTKSHTHLSSTGPSDPALAAHHTATEPALLDLQQDPIVKEKERRYSIGGEGEEEKWEMEEEKKSRKPRAHRGKIQLFVHPREIPEEVQENGSRRA